MKFLLPFSWLYSMIVALRNKMFDWGFIRVERIEVPVIAVGNITLGGTGKTPLVEYIVALLIRAGKKVAVVSRGYGRQSKGIVEVSNGKTIAKDSRQTGDEPLQIARKFPEAIVVVGENRVEAAKRARKLGAGVVVLDDGFQHRYLHRDMDVVLIDASLQNFPQDVLPAGIARESWQGLRRAGAVIFSRLGGEEDVESRRKRIGGWYSGPVFGLRHQAIDIRDFAGNTFLLRALKDVKIFAFSGIGNHESFIHSLKELGFNIVRQIGFRDHHTYSQSDLERIVSAFEQSGATMALTTEKDATRLQSIISNVQLVKQVNLHYMRIEAAINDRDAFDALMLKTASA